LPEDERAEKALDEEIRSGSRCYICCEELDHPGGTAVRLNGTLRRVCRSCHAWAKHLA
jgi:hypothetical protein